MMQIKPINALEGIGAVAMHEIGLAARLRRHVERLAGELGERHVFRPQAPHAAEDYLREV